MSIFETNHLKFNLNCYCGATHACQGATLQGPQRRVAVLSSGCVYSFFLFYFELFSTMQVNDVVFARLNPFFWHRARHIWVSPSPDITFFFDVAPESLGYGVPQGSYLGPAPFAIEKNHLQQMSLYRKGQTLPSRHFLETRRQDCIKSCCSAGLHSSTEDISNCVNASTTEKLRSFCLCHFPSKERQTEKILSLCWDFQQPSDQQRASLAKRTNNLSHIRALGDSQPSAELAPLLE